MKSYIVHIENKILFFYCEVEEQVQAVMIRWYGDKPYKIEACEFRSFYGYFSGFGAPGNRHIILDGDMTYERLIIWFKFLHEFTSKDDDNEVACMWRCADMFLNEESLSVICTIHTLGRVQEVTNWLEANGYLPEKYNTPLNVS